MLVGAAQASALVFWANTGNSTDGTSIGRADLDGASSDNFFIAGQDYPCGVAADSEHIYWAARADFPAGGIGRASLDGTGVDPQFIETGPSPCGVAVDDQHIYWAEFSNGTGTIGRADLDGGNPDPDFITTGDGACGVAVDDDHIYWGSRIWPGDIGRANLDGTGVDSNFVDEAEYSCGVAVNATHLYWSDLSEYYGQGSVGRANLDGTGADIDFIPNGAGVGSPCGVAVDDEHVYWGDAGAQTGPSRVGRAGLDGSDVEPSFIATYLSACGVAVNDAATAPPVCPDKEMSAVAGRAISIELACTGSGMFTYAIADPPAHGTIRRLDSASGKLAYIAASDFQGEDSFTFRATNTAGPSRAARVRLNVTIPNRFQLKALKRNRRHGTATLTVRIPGAGAIALSGNGIKRVKMRAGEAGHVRLRVRASGRKARRLRKRGKVAVRAKVAYRPAGGDVRKKTKRVKLVKKERKDRHR